jgi:hypothetical protein
LSYPLDYYYRLLEESSKLFLVLLVVASLILLATLVLCVVVWCRLAGRCGGSATHPAPHYASAYLSRNPLCHL